MQPAAAEIERDIGVRQPDRPGAPAETVAGFKQEDGKTRADCLQAAGGGNAGGTGADDDDILVGTFFVTRHAFSFGRSPPIRLPEGSWDLTAKLPIHGTQGTAGRPFPPDHVRL